MSNSEDPNALSIIFVGLMGAVGVFLVVILLQIVFFRMQEMETAKKVVSMAPEELATLRAQQQANLNGYGWVNQDEGVVRIPIERAMELTVLDINFTPEPAVFEEVDPATAALMRELLRSATGEPSAVEALFEDDTPIEIQLEGTHP